MKKYIFILTSIVLASCGGSDEEAQSLPTTPPSNDAPTVPSLVSPADGLLCTDNPLNFVWNASTDPDGDKIMYEIQVATNSTFTTEVQSKSNSTTSTDFSLMKGVEYFWRVRAKDSKNGVSNYSSVRKYYTEGEGITNHLPFTPTLIKPVLDSTIMDISTTLEWTSSDVDNDPIKYDIYFGNTNPPSLHVENSSSTTLQVDLSANKIYYWKIVAKDDKGGQTIGQIWSFKSK